MIYTDKLKLEELMTHSNMSRIGADFSDVFDLNIIIALINSNDEIGAVLRIHFMLESLIELWCNKITENEDFFGFKPRPNFSLKLEIAKKLGLNAEIARFIKTFNTVRNDMAHQKENIISTKVIDSLRHALDSMPSYGEELIPKIGDSDWSIQIDQRRYTWNSPDMSNIDRLMFLYFTFSMKVIDIFKKELTERGIPIEYRA